jgi:PAS domain S-box-containing protein
MIEFVNDQVLAWFGYSRPELIGESIEILVPGEARSRHRAQREGYVVHPAKRLMGKPGLDLHGRRKDGSEIPVDISLSTFETPSGRLTTAIVRDVTVDRRRERQAKFLTALGRVLTESLERNQIARKVAELAVPEIADGCVVRLLDGDGVLRAKAISHRSPEAKAILEKITFEREPERQTSSELESVFLNKKMVIRNEITDEVARSMSTPNSDLRELKDRLFSAYAAIPLDGKDSGVLVLLSTRAHQWEMESDVQFFEAIGSQVGQALENSRLYEESQKAVRLREEVLAVVSHDLKNPLCAIGVSAQLLERNAAKDPLFCLRQAATIRRSSKIMESMIGDLLDFVKMQAGVFELDRNLEDLSRVVTPILEMNRVIAAEKSIVLTYVEPERSPELECDGRRIGQVLSNLVSNAIKFTPDGGRVAVEIYLRERDILFSISDSGPGIPKEYYEKVFDRFWQAQQTKMHGAGLGLAIAKAIVEAHGGKIWVESAVPSGAIFRFTLPQGERESDPGPGMTRLISRPLPTHPRADSSL